MICNKCNFEFFNKSGYSNHIKKCELTVEIINEIINEYTINYLSIRDIANKHKITTGIIIRLLGNKIRTNKEANKYRKKKSKLKKETKEKISIALKKCHSEGRHPGWLHINKRLDKISYPEKFFLQVLTNNNLFSKYTIIQHLNVGKYCLDFAIIDLKLNIEIDGQQHYRNQKNINHDKIRNTYLIDNGWKIYRINWLNMYNNTKNEIAEFLNFINDINNNSSRYYDTTEIVKPKVIAKHGNRNDYNIARKNIKDNKEKMYIPIILNSDIDFTKFGWVNEVSILLNKKTQRINQWMKTYMFDFYNENCFKRKN